MPAFYKFKKMSEEVKKEVKQYSLGVTLGLIFGIYAFSLIASIIYLFCRVSRQRTSCVIFTLSAVYTSLFVFLNVMAIFDLFFNSNDGFNTLFNFLKKFYLGFNITDIAFGFFIFNILISYMESGYYSKSKKLFDYVFKFYYSIKKMSLCEKIVIIIFVVPIIGGLLAVLIIYKDHFNLGKNPLDYTDVIFNCYALFEIYTNVGFFIYQLIKDYKKRNNPKLINRYCNYSLKKIILKTDKYLKSIDTTYKELSKLAPIFESNPLNPYHVYLKNIFDNVKETRNILGLNNNLYNNVIINNTYNNNNVFPLMYINQENESENYEQNINNSNGQEMQGNPNNAKDINQNLIDNLEENFETSKIIRKYKKAVRRIAKLKKLYKEIEIERNKPISNSKCNFKFIIFFIAFVIAILTDFGLPLTLDYNKDYYSGDRSDLFDKKKSGIENVFVGILAMIIASAICCPYTIIAIYTTMRKRYISGDFLNEKKINDDINLLKTVQIVCGYSFAIVYCNLYLWKTLDTSGHFGKPYYYDEIVIPDYMIIHGLSIYMIIKILIIVVSIIGNIYFNEASIFKNDLAEYNKCRDYCEYDNNENFNAFLQKNYSIYSILKNY